MSAWPSQLQQKLNVDNFEYNIGETRVATDMDVGPAKVRSRFTKGVDGYTCAVQLDMTEISIFQTFYKTTLGNGVLPFNFPDPFTGADTIFRFSPSSSPKIAPLGGRVFTLTMVWEIMP